MEVIEGKPYDAIIQDRVFIPVHMDHTLSVVSHPFIPMRAQSYTFSPAGLWPTTPKDYSFLVGAGCVYSTPEDLYLMLRAVLDGKLSAMVKANLFKNRELYWNGLTNGFRAYVEYDPKDEVTVILCANMLTGAADRIRLDLPKIVRNEDVPPLRAPNPTIIKLPPSDLSEYAGQYQVEPQGAVTRIRVRGNYLLAGDDSALLPTGRDTFYSYRDYGQIHTVRDKEGKIDKLDWYEDGKVVVTLRRMKS